MTGNERPCPDDLVLHAQRHEVSDLERRALDAHLTQCGPCQAASAVAALFDAIPETEPGDSVLIARVMHKTMRTRRFRRLNGLRTAAIVALVVLTSGAAVGAWIAHRKVETPRDDKPLQASPVAARAQGFAKPTAEPAMLAAQKEPAPPALRESKRAAEPERKRKQALAFLEPAPSNAVAPNKEENTPASLFAQANALRRTGKVHQAIDLYRSLRQRFPESQQAQMSAISQGDLLLGEGQSAEAVAAYTAYLQSAPHGSMTEEALFGKARGLGQLGRSKEEKRAWEDLAQRFPRSAYHPAALRRLRELAR